MKKLNDSPSSPLRFITPAGVTLGQFYNSRDGNYHVAAYTPWEKPPSEYLCQKTGHFSPSRSEGAQRKGPCCPECVRVLRALSGLDTETFEKMGFS